MISWKPLVRGAAIVVAVFLAVGLATVGPCQAARRTWLDWLFGPPAQQGSGSPDEPAARALDVVFAFFMTGDASPESLGPASSTCEQLLDMLLKEPGRKFSVGMSARLASGLAWSGSHAVSLMRDGVSRGQFELMGSTHSDAVLAALDPWDARLAVQYGSSTVHDMFGKAPTGFWNPSGVWRQEIVLPINAGGYSHMMIDSKIVAASGLDALPAHAPLRVSWGGREIVVFQADASFARAVDRSVASGSPASAIAYLQAAYAEDLADAAVVVYTREVQASDEGQALQGFPPLLAAIEKEPWLRLTTLEERVQSGPRPRAVAQIPEGEPTEVRQAAAAAGHSDWQDYSANSRVLQDTRNLYGDVRQRIQAVEEDLHKVAVSQALAPAASRLLDHAKLVFAWHQRGFGRPGVDNAGSGQWEAVRAAYVAALAAWQCAHPTTSAYREDVNRDGIEEVVVVSPTDMFVLSPTGGKMLYWYDLEHGDQVVGSDLGEAAGEEFVNESVSAPGVRRRALVDSIAGAAVPAPGLEATTYSVQLGADSSSVVFEVAAGVARLRKEFIPGQRGFQVEYTLRARGRVDFSVTNAFNPDLDRIVVDGRDGLAYLHADGSPASALMPGSTFGVANVVSGSAVLATVNPGGADNVPAAEVWSDSALFDRSLSFRYKLQMWPGASASMSLGFERVRINTSAPPVLWIEPRGESIMAGIPSYTRRVAVRQLSAEGFPVDTLMLTAVRGPEANAPEAVAPMPPGEYDLITTSVLGRTTTIERADQYTSAGARFEFFPRIADSQVELAPGYRRVGSMAGIWWVALGAIAIAGGVVMMARSARRKTSR